MNFCLENFDYQLSDLLRSKNPLIVPKQCFHNSLRILKKYPKHKFLYVEGYAVLSSNGLVIEHGWLENDGKIIDVTLPGEIARYFAVDKFTEAEARRAGISERYVPEWFERMHKDASLADRIGSAYSKALAFAQILAESKNQN